MTARIERFGEMVKELPGTTPGARPPMIMAPHPVSSTDASRCGLSALMRAATAIADVISHPADTGDSFQVVATAIDELATGVDSDPIAMAATLFDGHGLRGATTDYYDVRNSLIPAVLQRRIGIPISLSVIFIEIAARHDRVVTAIGMPGHFLTGWGAAFIDPFHGGIVRSADQCLALYHATTGASGPMPAQAMAPISDLDIVRRMTANLVGVSQRSNPSVRMHALNLAAELPGADVPLLRAAAELAGRAGLYDRAGSVLGRAAAASRADADLSDQLEAASIRWLSRMN